MALITHAYFPVQRPRTHFLKTMCKCLKRLSVTKDGIYTHYACIYALCSEEKNKMKNEICSSYLECLYWSYIIRFYDTSHQSMFFHSIYTVVYTLSTYGKSMESI